MRPRAGRKALALLLALVILAGCHTTTPPPEDTVLRASSEATLPIPATEAATFTATALPSRTTPTITASSPSPIVAHTAQAIVTPTGQATSSATPSPTPAPAPTLPPLVTPAAGAPLDFSLGWQFNSNGHLTGGVVIDQGEEPVLAVTSLGRSAYALGEDGEILWQARTEAPVYALAEMGKGRMVIGDDAGAVTILDARGQQLLQHDLGSRVTALDATDQGVVLAGGWQEGSPHGGRLTVLDAEGGEVVRWQMDLDSPVTAVAIVPSAAGPGLKGLDLVVGATLDGKVHAFEAAGLESWRFDAGAPVTGLGLVEAAGEANLLVGTQDGRLLSLNPGPAPTQSQSEERARLLWQQDLGQGGPVWQAGDLDSDGTVEILAGTGGLEPSLARLSAQGQVVWRVRLPSRVNAIALIDFGGEGELEMLAGMASGLIQAYDGEGQLLGSTHAGLPVWGLIADSNGSAYALADVVAWRILNQAGPARGAWLPPPAYASAADEAWFKDNGMFSGRTDIADQVTLVFLGDVAPGRSMEAQLIRYGAEAPWGGLEPLLETADLTVGNLESVLSSQGQPMDKGYLIRAHPHWGSTLAVAGFGAVSVSNNHALDYGQAGLDDTLSTLKKLGVRAVGAAPSDDSGMAHRPALFELNGVRVALLGYAAARWKGSEDMPATEQVAWAEPETVRADLEAARDGADFVAVLLHAGTEYSPEPSPDQIAVARAAIDAGADLVVGHHSHVTQTVERYKQGLIVYSLGDAVFDIPRPAAMRGHLLRVLISRKGLSAAELWPFWIEDALCPRLLDSGDGTPRVEIVYP